MAFLLKIVFERAYLSCFLTDFKKVYDKKKLKNLNSIGVRDGVGGQGQYRVGRGSIGWAGAVLGRQGQYWLFHYQKSDFRHFE